MLVDWSIKALHQPTSPPMESRDGFHTDKRIAIWEIEVGFWKTEAPNLMEAADRSIAESDWLASSWRVSRGWRVGGVRESAWEQLHGMGDAKSHGRGGSKEGDQRVSRTTGSNSRSWKFGPRNFIWRSRIGSKKQC